MTTAKSDVAVTVASLGGWVAADPAKMETNVAVSLADFGAWMAMEQKRVYLLCLRLLQNGDDADSATQDAFLKAYQALQRHPEEAIAAPERWLTRIAVNTCLDLLRSRRWRFWRWQVTRTDQHAILSLSPASEASPERALWSRDIGRRLSRALDNLSLRQRSVFILRHEEDRSLEEIGDILGLNVGTVKAHMSRALKKLREELRDLYGRRTLE